MNKKIGRVLGPIGVLLVLFGLVFLGFIGLTEKTAMPIKSDFSWLPGLQVLLGLAFIAYYAATAFDEVRNIATGRGAAFVLINGGALVALLAVLVAVNYWASYEKIEIDLTKGGLHTLADQTKTALDGLDEASAVDAAVFYRAQDPEYAQVEELLGRYTKAGKHFTFHFVDPIKNPKAVKDAGIAPDGARIILKSKNQKEARAKEISEEAVTNALAELSRGVEKKIYFLTGHGEKPSTKGAETAQGLKVWTDGLRNEGYKVEDLSLLAKKDVPADAQALVVAGPAGPLAEGEIEAIKRFADAGGRVIAMLEPNVETGLEPLVASWGVDLLKGVVVDPVSQEPLWAFTQEFAQHPIATPTKSIFGALAFIFPEARGVKQAPAEGYTVTELFKTGPEAWGENDPLPSAGAGEAAATVSKGATDDAGPIVLAAAVSKKLEGEKEFRAVVFGDSDFVNNTFIRQGGNRDLALNSVQWLAGQEAKITIRPKLREKSSTLFLSANKKLLLAFGALNLLPFALIATGFTVWSRRRAR